MCLLAEWFWMFIGGCKQSSVLAPEVEMTGQKRVGEEWLQEYYPECSIDLSRTLSVSFP